METEGASVPGRLTFVLGHTHKPFVEAMECEGYGGGVKILNTGGWVVDTIRRDPHHGAAVVLVDEEMNAVSLRLFNEERYEARVEEPLAPGQRHGALYAHLRGIVGAKPEPWRGLGTTVAREVELRAGHLAARLRRRQSGLT
jgi:hypothetical protein